MKRSSTLSDTTSHTSEEPCTEQNEQLINDNSVSRIRAIREKAAAAAAERKRKAIEREEAREQRRQQQQLGAAESSADTGHNIDVGKVSRSNDAKLDEGKSAGNCEEKMVARSTVVESSETPQECRAPVPPSISISGPENLNENTHQQPKSAEYNELSNQSMGSEANLPSVEEMSVREIVCELASVSYARAPPTQPTASTEAIQEPDYQHNEATALGQSVVIQKLPIGSDHDFHLHNHCSTEVAADKSSLLSVVEDDCLPTAVPIAGFGTAGRPVAVSEDDSKLVIPSPFDIDISYPGVTYDMSSDENGRLLDPQYKFQELCQEYMFNYDVSIPEDLAHCKILKPSYRHPRDPHGCLTAMASMARIESLRNRLNDVTEGYPITVPPPPAALLPEDMPIGLYPPCNPTVKKQKQSNEIAELRPRLNDMMQARKAEEHYMKETTKARAMKENGKYHYYDESDNEISSEEYEIRYMKDVERMRAETDEVLVMEEHNGEQGDSPMDWWQQQQGPCIWNRCSTVAEQKVETPLKQASPSNKDVDTGADTRDIVTELSEEEFVLRCVAQLQSSILSWMKVNDESCLCLQKHAEQDSTGQVQPTPGIAEFTAAVSSAMRRYSSCLIDFGFETRRFLTMDPSQVRQSVNCSNQDAEESGSPNSQESVSCIDSFGANVMESNREHAGETKMINSRSSHKENDEHLPKQDTTATSSAQQSEQGICLNTVQSESKEDSGETTDTTQSLHAQKMCSSEDEIEDTSKSSKDSEKMECFEETKFHSNEDVAEEESSTDSSHPHRVIFQTDFQDSHGDLNRSECKWISASLESEDEEEQQYEVENKILPQIMETDEEEGMSSNETANSPEGCMEKQHSDYPSSELPSILSTQKRSHISSTKSAPIERVLWSPGCRHIGQYHSPAVKSSSYLQRAVNKTPFFSPRRRLTHKKSSKSKEAAATPTFKEVVMQRLEKLMGDDRSDNSDDLVRARLFEDDDHCSPKNGNDDDVSQPEEERIENNFEDVSVPGELLEDNNVTKSSGYEEVEEHNNEHHNGNSQGSLTTLQDSSSTSYSENQQISTPNSLGWGVKMKTPTFDPSPGTIQQVMPLFSPGYLWKMEASPSMLLPKPNLSVKAEKKDDESQKTPSPPSNTPSGFSALVNRFRLMRLVSKRGSPASGKAKTRSRINSSERKSEQSEGNIYDSLDYSPTSMSFGNCSTDTSTHSESQCEYGSEAASQITHDDVENMEPTTVTSSSETNSKATVEAPSSCSPAHASSHVALLRKLIHSPDNKTNSP